MKNILLIEDNEPARAILTSALSQDGRNILGVGNGEEAFAAISNSVPDLILLDLLLPGASGFEILQKLREEKKFQGPILILSNLGGEENTRRGILLGANGYLIKGKTSMKMLKENVQNILG